MDIFWNYSMRDYMDGQVTPPKRVTSPTWDTPPPCKQALSFTNSREEKYPISKIKIQAALKLHKRITLVTSVLYL